MRLSVEQVVAEIKEREAAEKAVQDAKLEKVKAQYRTLQYELDAPRREQEKAEKVKKQESEERTEKELKHETRRQFFAGTPNASEELYQTHREEVRRDILRARRLEAESLFQQARNHPIYKI